MSIWKSVSHCTLIFNFLPVRLALVLMIFSFSQLHVMDYLTSTHDRMRQREGTEEGGSIASCWNVLTPVGYPERNSEVCGAQGGLGWGSLGDWLWGLSKTSHLPSASLKFMESTAILSLFFLEKWWNYSKFTLNYKITLSKLLAFTCDHTHIYAYIVTYIRVCYVQPPRKCAG